MIAFKEMHLTVFRRSVTKAHPEGEGMIAWEAQGPLVGDTDEKKYSSETGIQYLSFFFTFDEWSGVMDGKISGCNDIGHNLRACGDSFTFFDMEFSRDVRGVMRVPFVTLHVPYYVRRILRRAVDSALKKCEPDGDRIKVELPFEIRERWERQYGCGKGSVRVDSDENTLAFLAACEAEGGETFARSWENVKAIAQNTTARHTDVATVRLQKDWDGLYWVARAPSGHAVMNGGIVNHGARDGGHDWSVHT